MNEKVSISILPTVEKINKYDVKVQDFQSYEVYVYETNLDRDVAEALVEELKTKFPNHCYCLFK